MTIKGEEGVPADTNGSTSGDPENNPNNTSNDSVSRSAYEKLLREKRNLNEALKNTNAEMATIREQIDSLSAKDAEAKGEWQKLLEGERKKNETLASQLAEKDKRITDFETSQVHAKKFSAVLSELGGAVDKKFWGLIDVDDLEVDEDGTVNAKQVKELANTLRNNYPEIITPKKGSFPPGKMPGDGKHVTKKRVTGAEYNRMSLEEKRKFKPSDIDWG